MRLLLLNNNPAVSRLIKLSVDKVGYELDEFDDYGLIPLKNYDIIMVDSESYDEAELASICEQKECNYILYIAQRGTKKPELADVALEKPFLPTDFLALLEKIKNVLKSKPSVQEPVEEYDVSEEEDEESEALNAFDIDDINALTTEEEPLIQRDENEVLDENDKEEDDDDDFALELASFGEENEDTEDEPLTLPIFDLDSKEEKELDLSLDDDIESLLEETEEKEDDEKPELLESEPEEESIPSVLDRDDINEVKQLLDESEDAFSFDEEELESEVQESEDEKEEIDFSLKEEEDEDPLTFEELAIDETPMSIIENEIITPVFSEEVDTIVEENNDNIEADVRDDFEEDKIEALEDDVLTEIEEIKAPKNNFMSLDDLDENSIKRAFGEEIEEEAQNDSVQEEPASEESESKDAEVIRGEIENTIARSLSGLAQSDVLREALRGMRINISITFDEKN